MARSYICACAHTIPLGLSTAQACPLSFVLPCASLAGLAVERPVI